MKVLAVFLFAVCFAISAEGRSLSPSYVSDDIATRGTGSDLAVEKIMELADKALEKIPEDMRSWVRLMIEQVLDFGLTHGKKGIIIALDKIDEISGGKATMVITMIKGLIEQYAYSVDTEVRGPATELAVEKILEALEKPFEALPEDIRAWVELMIEQVLRFGLAHGKTGVIKGLEKINDLTGGKITLIVDTIKGILDQYVFAMHSEMRGAGSDLAIEKIMEAADKALEKIPESMRSWVRLMIEQVLDFGLTHGKKGIMIALDKIDEITGGKATMVITMIKGLIEQYAYSIDTDVRGPATELAVSKIMQLLEKPLAALPDDIGAWVKLMIEQVLRFGLSHGKNGIIKGLEKIDELTKGKISSIIDIVKGALDQYVYSIPVTSRGAATELVVEKVMEALQKPFAELPEDIKDWVELMIEQVLRFGLSHGTTGVIKGLEKIDDLTGGRITTIVDVVKEMIEKYVYALPTNVRGTGTELAVEVIMNALQKPLANLPEDIKVWVELMIEQVLRFGLTHGKTGVIKGLEQIDALTKGKITPIIDVVKEMLDKYVFYSVESRAAGIDFAVEKIMSLLEKPFAKLPDSVREWLTVMTEEAIRFAFTHGKNGAMILLDLIGEKGGPDVQSVIMMVKIALEQYV